jgi:hypothetical protein
MFATEKGTRRGGDVPMAPEREERTTVVGERGG